MKEPAHERLHHFPRLNFGFYPTPIEELSRLRTALGPNAPRLLIKRDDYTGPGFGGNKVRKLEYALAQAKTDGAEIIITMGGEKSNHARVTATLCARLGLRCELVMNPPAVRFEGLQPASLLTDQLYGATIHRVANREERRTRAAELLAAYEQAGQRAVLLPLGASTPIGALGYVRAVEETKAQLAALNVQVTHVVHATSSGGTQAGLVAGCQLFDWRVRVLGISPDDPSASIAAEVGQIIDGIGELLELPAGTLDNRVTVLDEFVGGGYGIPTDESTAALQLLARQEGLLLDPVYTAKAMAGLLALIQRGELTAADTMLFWHTGGQLALFYALEDSDEALRGKQPLKVDDKLPSWSSVAYNYGAAHANRIHSDEGAAEYGFPKALVPGVAVYAYLIRPAVKSLGLDWLTRGAASVRFLQPVYDGDRVIAEAVVTRAEPLELNLRLLNAEQQTYATGTAALPTALPPVNPADYPAHPLPTPEQLRPATSASFTLGEVLGSLEFTLDWAAQGAQFLSDMREPLPIFAGADAPVHPAFWLAQANEMLMRNVALGMWIHVGSEIQHYALAKDGEHLAVRGRVVDLYERRGHEYIVAELVVLGEAERLLVHIKHTAIIKLKESK
jgi:1-aminocyclopropane-1-carboxylate deaminase/D-cysteine desulfhydrase-like pyridoxal-dependent ACC family enzyme/acyl dehydratase